MRKLEEVIGLNLLKCGGKGEEELFSLKEVTLLSTDNPMNSANIQMKRINEQKYISGHQIVYQNEPMPIRQHVVVMRETLNLIQGDEKMVSKINSIVDNLRKENTDEESACEKALVRSDD